MSYRTASAVWRFGEETLVSDPSSGGAFIAPPFFFVATGVRYLRRPVLNPTSLVQPVRYMNALALPARFEQGAERCGAVEDGTPKRSRGGPFPDRPSSSIRKFWFGGSPGVRMDCQSNFSKNNKAILIIDQYAERAYIVAYSATCDVRQLFA